MAFIEKEIRYLPKLEDKIEKVFDKVLVKYFPSLTLRDEERYDLKQMLKFLISNEEKDAFTKKYNINRVKKLLISSDSKERIKGELILQALKNLNEKQMATDILNGMAISSSVIQLMIEITTSEIKYKQQIDSLWDILHLLDKVDDEVINVKNYLKKHLQLAKKTSVSQSDEAVTSLLNLLDSMKTSKNNASHDYDIFIYTKDLEKKLGNVQQNTWQKLVLGNKVKRVICFYAPSLPEKNMKLSQEPEKYVCRELSEVLDIVRKERDKN